MDRNKCGAEDKWVEERMATLNRSDGWEPNLARGLAQLNERLRARTGKRRACKWAMATVVVLGLSLTVLPSPRVLAHLCVECSMAVWQSLGSQGSAKSELKAAANRKKAPEFVLTDAGGKTIRLSEFKGKVALVNFWATWCEGCQVEIPWFVEFQKKHAARGLKVVGVSVDDEGWKVVKPWIVEKNVNYPIVLGSEELKKLFGVESLPVTFLIDRMGNIAAVYEGLVNKDVCEKDLSRLLEEESNRKTQ
jgi:peroxiredoxin